MLLNDCRNEGIISRLERELVRVHGTADG